MAKHAALPMKPLWDIARSMSDDPMFNQRDFARAVNHSTRAVTRWITAGETLSWLSHSVCIRSLFGAKHG
jgi:hypothetical protein